jgi:ankyrin repeat protein
LHIACANQPDLDTVALLIDVYPKAIDQQDKLGRLPLHTACSNRASIEVVEYLWRQNPETVFEVTDRGVSTLRTRSPFDCRVRILCRRFVLNRFLTCSPFLI